VIAMAAMAMALAVRPGRVVRNVCHLAFPRPDVDASIRSRRLNPLPSTSVRLFNTPANGNALNMAEEPVRHRFRAAVLTLPNATVLPPHLAQPNLTTVSGETAEFLAGGQFPIPVADNFGAITVQFRDYGVSLRYTPTVQADGRILLRVRPEVSDISSQGAVRIAGTEIPAITTRMAETTVELGSGESFMIAG
jgi:pilus assembly protein CpaC